jgi:hypothetical protein
VIVSAVLVDNSDPIEEAGIGGFLVFPKASIILDIGEDQCHLRQGKANRRKSFFSVSMTHF